MEVDQSRGFSPDHIDQQVEEQLALSRTEIARLDGHLLANEFERPILRLAAELVSNLGRAARPS